MSDFNELPALGEEAPTFNMGVSTLMRIHVALIECNTARSKKQINEWWEALTTVYVEARPFMKEAKERTGHDNTYRECQKLVGEWQNYDANFLKQPQYLRINYRPPMKAVQKILSWELELRDCLLKHKLLMRTGEDATNTALRL